MHPTMNQMLVQDRHATLNAEAEAARLATMARSGSTIERAARPQPGLTRLGVVRRLVHRLVPA